MFRETTLLNLSRAVRLCLAAALVLPAFAGWDAEPQPAPPPPPPPPAPAYSMVLAGGSYLGVGVREIDEERARALKLKEAYGVEITRVDDGSPAAKAGLKVSDVVLDYNGTRVEGIEQFARLVRETPANRTVRMTVVREGASMNMTATIGARKGPKVMTWTPPGDLEKLKLEVPKVDIVLPDIPRAMLSWRSTVLGVEGEPLGESQLAEYFGVKEGVLVRSVIKGTAADRAGIKAGDVLLKIDDTALAAPKDITNALRAARNASKKTLNLSLMREKREISIPVTLEDDEPRPVTRGRRVTAQQE